MIMSWREYFGLLSSGQVNIWLNLQWWNEMTFPGNTLYDAMVFEVIEHGLKCGGAQLEASRDSLYHPNKPLLPSSGTVCWGSLNLCHIVFPHSLPFSHLMECHLGLWPLIESVCLVMDVSQALGSQVRPCPSNLWSGSWLPSDQKE